MKTQKHFIVPGTSNKDLSKKISIGSDTPLAKVISRRFSNGEAQVRIEEVIFAKRFYIIQSL